jgi:hypothetical protein
LDQNVAVTACGEFTWDVNGQTYYFTGTHLANFTNQYGCDSTFILDLTILTPPNISISSGGLSLSVPSGALSYQWLDCDANYAPIFGANLHTFSPSYNGFFAVQVSNQNCTDTSACLPITQVGLSDLSLDFSLVPNPTNGAVQLNFGATIDNLTIKVMDASARLLDEYHFDAVTETQLNINGESGVYFIVMEWNYSRIVERVVKTNF